ncbi:MAG: TaqI-like C-terminal specificity domain-containing protein [Candidatus Woesearchaeota archaeon]
MNQQQAKWLLDETFNQEFDVLKFSNFLKELVNNSNLYSQDKTQFVAKEFRDYILKVEKLGQYKDKAGKSMELLAIKLAKHSSLERARTMQRNFIAKWLAKNPDEPEGAIVGFYDDEKDWRFSFVKLEYNLIKDEKGNLKAKKELTPAKRYSYLVGPNEPNHTCKKQFVELLSSDHDPLFEEIERSFGIEKVTKEFFEEYKKRFLDLKESLEKVIKNDAVVKAEFVNIAGEENLERFVVEFSKKLLGQIVFLYFLQKKGWLGVRKDDSGRFKDWGTGPKDFMKRLFNREYCSYNNFFNDVLEPLFYNTLAIKRNDDFSDKFDCKIPFLNGGLFEPLDGYDWMNTNIYIENSIFEDIFRTFDEFNFTIKEDEPLEKEVAVDPEMLGKVFENLLEVTDRKSKGAFYTPREIVHYMCQQSLINYLETNSSVPRKDIEKFIQEGDKYLDQTIKAQEHKKKYHGNVYGVDSEYTIPKSIEDNYEKIDELLKNIKVVDPAVGSGAFPVGMMNEIVKARSILSIYFEGDRDVSEIKRECIDNSLYGVDIMPSAVDICQLRFWLSLVVDELDRKKIKPLPNLDNKIMCGNSLLEEFEGVKLFDDSLLGEEVKDIRPELERIEKEIKELNLKAGEIILGKLKGSIDDIKKSIKKLEREKKKLTEKPKKTTVNATLTNFDKVTRDEAKIKLKKLKSKQKEFFNSFDRDTKKQLKQEIEKLEWELIEATLKQQGNDEAINKLNSIMKSKSKPFFLWKLYFSEVFQRENPGFDVVIGNPPYISYYSRQSNHLPNEIRKSFLDNFECVDNARSRINAIQLFIEKGNKLLQNKGILAYIIDKTFLNEKANISIRKYLLNNSRLLIISPFLKNVFDATVDPMILITKKEILKEYSFKIIENEIINNDLKLLNFNIDKVISNIGYEIKADLLSLDIDFFKIFKGTEKLKKVATLKSGANIGGHKEKFLSEKPINNKYKPVLKGSKNIRKYRLTWDEPLYILYDHELQYKINDEAQKNIGTNKKINLVKLGDGHIDKRYEKEKLIIRQSSSQFEATFDNKSFYCMYGLFIINQLDADISLKYLLALINSKLYTYYGIKSETIITGHKKQPQIRAKGIKELPIKKISPEQQKPFIQLVDQILSITKDEDYLKNPDKQSKVRKLEKEINKLVYELYELTPEEIKIVEEFNEK